MPRGLAGQPLPRFLCRFFSLFLSFFVVLYLCAFGCRKLSCLQMYLLREPNNVSDTSRGNNVLLARRTYFRETTDPDPTHLLPHTPR